MEQEKISAKQLFSLIILFEFGTSLVLPIGFVAEQSVWISILLALIGGVVLYVIFDYLYREHPGLPLSGYIRRILGSVVGWPVCLLYLSFFIQGDARVLRDTGELLISSSYDQTPLFVINAMLMLSVIYVLRKGVVVLARTSEIFLIVVILLGALGATLVLLSGIIHVQNLLPLAGNGWKPVLTAAYGNILPFPFSETICFATILPQLRKKATGRKAGIVALLIAGLVMSFTHAMEIAVLGANIYGRSTFPLFLTISKVNILDFIQRMDGIVILTLIVNAFFKIAIFCYAAASVAADLFRVSKPEKLMLPIGLVILLISMMSANNWSEFVTIGNKVFVGMLLPLHNIAIPVLLLAVHLIRKSFRAKISR
ncbi:GerAB/ArcD/ProY family transporter [Cohnella zeiphila]|uniref:GerAB/ArcD/ProY family transporter n=1 Tax=Cohnella zeiphila TaxID=2761120 RepID=A0A7X0SHT3_9BACL|nr:GerAB/ArcD/ProY family transporter [Cohnella zeiphila]